MKKRLSPIIAVVAVVFLVSGLFADGDAFYKIIKIDDKTQSVTVNEWDITNQPVGKPFTIKVTAKTVLRRGESAVKFGALKKEMQIELTYNAKTKEAEKIVILD